MSSVSSPSFSSILSRFDGGAAISPNLTFRTPFSPLSNKSFKPQNSDGAASSAGKKKDKFAHVKPRIYSPHKINTNTSQPHTDTLTLTTAGTTTATTTTRVPGKLNLTKTSATLKSPLCPPSVHSTSGKKRPAQKLVNSPLKLDHRSFNEIKASEARLQKQVEAMKSTLKTQSKIDVIVATAEESSEKVCEEKDRRLTEIEQKYENEQRVLQQQIQQKEQQLKQQEAEKIKMMKECEEKMKTKLVKNVKKLQKLQRQHLQANEAAAIAAVAQEIQTNAENTMQMDEQSNETEKETGAASQMEETPKQQQVEEKSSSTQTLTPAKVQRTRIRYLSMKPTIATQAEAQTVSESSQANAQTENTDEHITDNDEAEQEEQDTVNDCEDGLDDEILDEVVGQVSTPVGSRQSLSGVPLTIHIPQREMDSHSQTNSLSNGSTVCDSQVVEFVDDISENNTGLGAPPPTTTEQLIKIHLARPNPFDNLSNKNSSMNKNNNKSDSAATVLSSNHSIEKPPKLLKLQTVKEEEDDAEAKKKITTSNNNNNLPKIEQKSNLKNSISSFTQKFNFMSQKK